MKISRKNFIGLAGVAATQALLPSEEIEARTSAKDPADAYGCIVDLTRCIGCRLCERACNEVNLLPKPDVSFDDKKIFDTKRRPDDKAYTVVNRYHTGKTDKRERLIDTYEKVQCMHCQDPACASACIVGALFKHENGAVTWDEDRCIGCRYCMVACPFEIPAYEYHNALDPEVRKCTFCYDRISDGGLPACAEACPVEAITFGKRKDLLPLAKERIKNNPNRYVEHIYGEKEVGGTSWMYLASEPFEKLGFQKLPEMPMPERTEKIQHGLFSYLWSPIALFAALMGVMKRWEKKNNENEKISKGDQNGK